MSRDRTGAARLAEDFRWEIPSQFNFAVDVVDAWAQKETGPCLVWENGEGEVRRYSFAEMSRLTKKFAAALREAGLRKGDRVMVVLPRVPEWQVAMVALLRIGAIPIPGIEMLTERDVAYRMENSGAKAFICRKALAAKYADALSGDTVRFGFGPGEAGDGWIDADEAMAGSEPLETPASIAAEDPAIMYYTSGSTAHPKGVLHSARALYAWRMSARYWLDLGPGDIIWCTADTGWSKAGTSILFGPLSEGATTFFYHGDFDPRRRLELLAKHRVSVYCAPATELNRVVGEAVGDFDLSRLRRTVSAGEAMSPAVAERWLQATGVEVAEAYGQTEALMIALNMPGQPVKLGSMGLPAPGCDTDIVDEDGNRLADGIEGDIALRTPNPQLMLEYWQEPDRYRQSFVEGPEGRWFLTGDRGVRDADGYLWYRGRSDDVINSAGYRIGPIEVENALLEHEAVLECAVVGAPDPDRGEIVKGFVVLAQTVSPSPDLTRELQEHVKRITAPYKYPRAIEYCDSLPRTITGKIMRRALRERRSAPQPKPS